MARSNPEASNFAIYMWKRADPKAAELGDPFDWEPFETQAKLEDRVRQLQSGGKFNYLWWGAWNDTAMDYTNELGDWWRP